MFLGVGLDFRGRRLLDYRKNRNRGRSANTSKNITVFEVDSPEIIDFRSRLIHDAFDDADVFDDEDFRLLAIEEKFLDSDTTSKDNNDTFNLVTDVLKKDKMFRCDADTLFVWCDGFGTSAKSNTS